MKTLNEQLTDLRAANATELNRKERELSIQVQLMELTGIKFSVLIHRAGTDNESTSIWAENSRYGQTYDRAKINEYYRQICTIYTPQAYDIPTSGNSYHNESPVTITIDNNTSDIVFNHDQKAKIDFTFAGNVTVSFQMQAAPHYGNFDANVLTITHFCGEPQNKQDRQEKTMYKLCRI